jgi:pimeloyl-ACP methyl ester carboxylesterase
VAAALAAAGVDRPPKSFTLVGYSAGAGIGEQMVQLWPERYPRVVLIGAPSDPRPERLAHARGAVTMSCSLDVPGRMKSAARRIASSGIAATYLEMPGCTHGNIADGERVFGSAFDWLEANAASVEPEVRP